MLATASTPQAQSTVNQAGLQPDRFLLLSRVPIPLARPWPLLLCLPHQAQRRRLYLPLSQILHTLMRLALFIIVLHILLALENRVSDEVVALSPRVIDRAVGVN